MKTYIRQLLICFFCFFFCSFGVTFASTSSDIAYEYAQNKFKEIQLFDTSDIYDTNNSKQYEVFTFYHGTEKLPIIEEVYKNIQTYTNQMEDIESEIKVLEQSSNEENAKEIYFQIETLENEKYQLKKKKLGRDDFITVFVKNNEVFHSYNKLSDYIIQKPFILNKLESDASLANKELGNIISESVYKKYYTLKEKESQTIFSKQDTLEPLKTITPTSDLKNKIDIYSGNITDTSLSLKALTSISETNFSLAESLNISNNKIYTAVITHGFQLTGNRSTWVDDMAESIGAMISEGAIIYDFDPVDGQFYIEEIIGNGKHAILKMDWAEASNDLGEGYSEAAGDSLFQALLYGEQNGGFSLENLHLIGHSRGTVVNSEVAERLLHNGSPVMQVTTLDPHDGGAMFESLFTDYDVNSTLNDSGVISWKGIGWSDNYYQENDGLEGRIIIGSDYTIKLSDELADDANMDCIESLISSDINCLSHGNIHDWYQGTIDMTTGEDWYYTGPRPAREDSGFQFTLELLNDITPIYPDNINKNPITNTSNSSIEPQFDFFEPKKIYGTQTDVYQGIINGDSRRQDVKGDGGIITPGWFYFGGEGKMYQNFSEVLELNNTTEKLTHNYLYIPESASDIEYQFKIEDKDAIGTPKDTFQFIIEDENGVQEIMKEIVLDDETDGFITNTIPLDNKHKGTHKKIILKIVAGSFGVDSEVHIDDIRFKKQTITDLYSSFDFIQPSPGTNTAVNSFEISWNKNLPNKSFEMTLYYDTDDSGDDGTQIIAQTQVADGIGSYTWDTSNIPEADYYIYAKISDGTNEIIKYTQNKITVLDISSSFPDIPSDHWSKVYIQHAHDNDIINGYDDGLFRPERDISRIEALAIIYKAYAKTGQSLNLGECSTDLYSNVKKDDWYCKHIQHAQNNDIFLNKGVMYFELPGDGSFPIDEKVDRAEVTLMISNTFGIDLENTSCLLNQDSGNIRDNYSDVPNTHPAHPAIYWMTNAIVQSNAGDSNLDVSLGSTIVNGYENGNFGPQNHILRQEMAAIGVKTKNYFLNSPIGAPSCENSISRAKSSSFSIASEQNPQLSFHDFYQEIQLEKTIGNNNIYTGSGDYKQEYRTVDKEDMKKAMEAYEKYINDFYSQQVQNTQGDDNTIQASKVSGNSISTAEISEQNYVSIGYLYEQISDPSNISAPAPLYFNDGSRTKTIEPHQTLTITGNTTDGDGDSLFYFWNANGGSFTTTDESKFSEIIWTPPSNIQDETIFSIHVTIGDGRGFIGESTLEIIVSQKPFESCDQVTEISKSECDALVALYNSTDGSYWGNNDGWLQHNSLCSWYGVSCIENKVVGLMFPHNSLSGGIPPEIENLDSLTDLDISFNNLSGSIPLEIGNLDTLINLDLSWNNLTGNIPPEIENLDSLTDLDLSFNNLSGSIPSEIGNLGNLINLSLSSNGLSGSIPSNIGNLDNLSDLDLSWNDLTGSIPPEIGNLNNLKGLYIYYNQLSGSIPSTIVNLNNLINLDLSSNRLSGNIPSDIGNLNNLGDLDLSDNQLDGSIPSSIVDLDNLTDLDLTSNMLIGNMPSEIGNLDNLINVYIYFNQLSGSIPSSIGNLSNLTHLYLSSNQLTGSIPSSIGNLDNLLYLDFTDNQLSGNIPSEIGNLDSLTNIYLSSNQLSGSIPSSIGNLDNLIYLSLSSNQLSGNIPSEIENLDNLTNLILYSNQLNGSIPSEIEHLNNLTDLDLTDNQLSGNIPSSIGNLESLGSLRLSSNQLKGELPITLIHLADLQSFNINYNGLFSSDTSLIQFLNEKSSNWDKNWQSTQTIPPDNIEIVINLDNTLTFSWTPIQYQEDEGYYQVKYRNSTGENFDEIACVTTDKTQNGCSTGVMQAGNYDFVVQTYSDIGRNNQNTLWSNYSNIISASLESIENNQPSAGPIIKFIEQNTSLDINILIESEANDADGDTLTIVSISPAAYGNATLSGNNLSYSPNTNFSGVEDFSYTISDGNDGTIIQTISIFVNTNYDCRHLTEIPKPECEALLSLYQNSDGENWKNNDNWLQNNRPCSWYGVSCNENRVVGLNLYANQLAGQISEEIQNLTQLQKLYLGFNTLTHIPSQLQNLENLESVSIGYNSFDISDQSLIDFLNERSSNWDKNWQSVQAIPPSDFTATSNADNSTTFAWTPIAYQQNEGYYQVKYSNIQNKSFEHKGSEQIACQSENKASNSCTMNTPLGEDTDFLIQTYTAPHTIQIHIIEKDFEEIVDVYQDEVWSEASATLTIEKPTQVCETKIDYKKNYRCSGTKTVKNLTQLDRYLNNYGYKKGKYKNLVIDFDIESENIDIHSPCNITFKKKTKLKTQGDICLDAKTITFQKNNWIDAENIAILARKNIVIAKNSNIKADSLDFTAGGKCKLHKKNIFEVATFTQDCGIK